MDPVLRRALASGLHRIPGSDGLAKLLTVRLETVQAVLERRLDEHPLPVPDALTPSDIPSVAELGPGDRVLADIDQDGFAFAVHPADVPFFNRRAEKMPRMRYHLHVVLHKGFVCVRKRFTGQPSGTGAPLSARMLGIFGLFYYTEVCALLRLRDLPCVPRIRHVELLSRTLYMDYVRGRTFQHRVADTGQKVLDIDLAPLGQRFDPARDRREIEAFASGDGDRFRASVEELVLSINARGVAPLDVKLGNVIVGEKTGAVYWIDFERAALEGTPSYDAQLAEHRRLVNQWFGLSLPERAAP